MKKWDCNLNVILMARCGNPAIIAISNDEEHSQKRYVLAQIVIFYPRVRYTVQGLISEDASYPLRGHWISA